MYNTYNIAKLQLKTEQEIDFLEQKFDMYYSIVYDQEYNSTGTPAGLYDYPKDVMCIYLKGKAYIDALETFNHEWLHHHDKTCHFDSTPGCS